MDKTMTALEEIRADLERLRKIEVDQEEVNNKLIKDFEKLLEGIGSEAIKSS